MPVLTLTARILQGGQVKAVRQSAFFVKSEGETREQAAEQLEELAEVLEADAEELEHARFDPQHRKHHWWMP